MRIIFVNNILKSEAWNIEFANFKFSRFWVKIPGFYYFLSKFQAFSRPEKENGKIPGFQGFPGRMGTLILNVWDFENPDIHF